VRVALYARYSSDLQNQRSAADQLAALQRVVDQRGWTTAAVFADEGISGATLGNRPGILALLAGAAVRDFDLVLAEDLDRLARDQESAAHVRKRLAFADVALETLTQGRLEGQAGIMQSAFAGAMGELFLDNLRHKTRRGLEARVRGGFSGGGLCYGYQLVPGEQKGVLEIDPDQAAIVRRIFLAYARGATPRSIAIDLNREGIPGPRGGAWSPTTVSGDRRAGDGILCQELYIGVRVFNRRQYRKHPDTGKRSSRLNPPNEWIRMPAPELRILTDDVWEYAQARQRTLGAQPAYRARKPRRLLSGLLHCSLCGGSMTLNGPRLQCSNNRERGTCRNGKTIAPTKVEARVIEGVRTRLLSPAAIAAAARAYQVDMEAARKAAAHDRLPLERELAELGRRIDRATEAYLAGQIELDAFAALQEPLKARRADISAQLALAAGGGDQVVQLHPGAVEAYRCMAVDLHESLADPDADEVREIFRKLIDRVDFVPEEGLGKFGLVVHGRLAGILQVASPRRAQNSKNPTAGDADCGVLLGAGARSGQYPTVLVAFAA
jgi:site-specific DNA recombinase